ncbi:hypothetical protein ACIP79_33590 [Streptomyces sp. NPDC088747]|uniref:hypothetical protein n=1 Tax=Streptomyces sp. NPDC088747 TaxID=3365886 RepID=UPI00381703D9
MPVGGSSARRRTAPSPAQVRSASLARRLLVEVLEFQRGPGAVLAYHRQHDGDPPAHRVPLLPQ